MPEPICICPRCELPMPAKTKQQGTTFYACQTATCPRYGILHRILEVTAKAPPDAA
jgi:hypothetical protein